MKTDNQEFVPTNIRVFYHIAREAHVAMEKESSSRKRPRPNGEPGWILTYDPEQKSFKNAFITIVFCGVFIEALFHLLIVKRKGLAVFKKYDRKPYGEKLQLLGCNDQAILGKANQYQTVRNEVIHEKAYLTMDSFRIAQKDAVLAMDLVNQVVTYFAFAVD